MKVKDGFKLAVGVFLFRLTLAILAIVALFVLMLVAGR